MTALFVGEVAQAWEAIRQLSSVFDTQGLRARARACQVAIPAVSRREERAYASPTQWVCRGYVPGTKRGCMLRYVG